MVDAAEEWQRRGHRTWFIVPRPRAPFGNGAGRPSLVELLDTVSRATQPTRIEPAVGPEFELGTNAYRAGVYAHAAAASVPAGVPVVVSDDAAAWQAAERLADRNPFVGVLHADDRWYYDLVDRHRGSVAALVAVSERIARKTRETLTGRDIPLLTIPCGISLPSPAPASIEVNRGRGVRRLIWAGRIDERQKRVSDLGRIAETLTQRGIDFEFDILGDGYDSALILDQLSPAAAARVHLRSWLPAQTVSRMLGSADVMLLPSNFEGMPLAAMEALAHGCGVVASNSSGLEEYAARPDVRECLWIHEVGDVAAAAAAVEVALHVNPVSRATCARDFAESEFAIATCMDRYHRIVGSLQPRVLPRVRREPWMLTRLLSYGIATARRGRRWLAKRRAERGEPETVRSETIHRGPVQQERPA